METSICCFPCMPWIHTRVPVCLCVCACVPVCVFLCACACAHVCVPAHARSLVCAPVCLCACACASKREGWSNSDGALPAQNRLRSRLRARLDRTGPGEWRTGPPETRAGRKDRGRAIPPRRRRPGQTHRVERKDRGRTRPPVVKPLATSGLSKAAAAAADSPGRPRSSPRRPRR